MEQFPQLMVGFLPMFLALAGVWAMGRSFKRRRRLDIVGLLVSLCFWSLVFATPAFSVPPLLIITIVSQSATLAATLLCLQSLNVRAANGMKSPLFVSRDLKWRLPLLVGLLFLVAVNFFTLEFMEYDCTQRCGSAGYVLGTAPEFAALYTSNFFGALALFTILGSLVVAYKKTMAG